ncbi:MAG: bifunctional adenosylcobinamide kinase/adenosylcobinamide-phosphate guanylyltransferase, partial [Lachnospiraceae bacterium]|nr:bifunctional adenosylcobinamide kinase/adenosylcobinamide-phosphate guanylyltransferase [Lachnospiraceae bacterium]
FQREKVSAGNGERVSEPMFQREKVSAGNGERVSEPMVQREKVSAGNREPIPEPMTQREKASVENGEPVSKPMAQREKASAGDRKPTRKPVVLLECLSNLLANEMFAPEITEGMRAKATFGTELCEKICADILALEAAASCLIVVSCNVSEDGASYPWETVKYIHILEQIQVRIAKEADRVYEVVCGIPVILKE